MSMTIPEQEKLIDEMIKEDNNSTIRDFIGLRKELFDILSASDKNGKKRNIPVQYTTEG